MATDKKIRLAGALILTGMCAGIFSVAPAVDSINYITAAARNSNQVILAAVFQFVMSLTYMGTAILLYPMIKRFSAGLSIGFLSFRIVAATLSIIGTLLLLSILAVSQEHLQTPSQTLLASGFLGNVLKTSRDYINHVFMVLVLCAGNYLCYRLLYKAKLVPRWLSIWGMTGAFLSVIASILVLFRQLDIITSEYLALNVPTALHELVLGVWLTIKGELTIDTWNK